MNTYFKKTIRLQRKLDVVALCAWCVFCSSIAAGQESNRVLFLGNSYTGTNNLPQLIHDVALSAGDTLVFDSHTPGGYQLLDHFFDMTSQNKIMSGDWDYVVIQAQSQEPIIQPGIFESYTGQLHSQIYQYNPCAIVMPFMTWGRENGDLNNCESFPAMCTYEEMDTALMQQYLHITDNILNGVVSPVSVVWRYLRQNHPSIDLYTSDGSHPSQLGSYAAACSFYASIFRKDPTSISYNFGLDPNTATTIRSAAKLMVYDQLHQWDFTEPPHAEISVTVSSAPYEMTMSALNPENVTQTYSWDLGDGNNSDVQAIDHDYLSNGTYTVELTTTTCESDSLFTAVADTTFQLCEHTPIIYDNGGLHCNGDTLWTQPADSYQWYLGCTWWQACTPIPNATDSLLIYDDDYLPSQFISVLTTQDGCTEMSFRKSFATVGSAHYFDIQGNPCEGDTAIFTVHHIGGELTGFEVINWYQDGELLTSWSNQDTLHITQAGIYECSIIDSLWGCPLDTTFSSAIEFDCTVGIHDNDGLEQNVNFTLFPNPATNSLTIECHEAGFAGYIRVYDLLGALLIEHAAAETTQIDISELNKGIYFVYLIESSKQQEVKPCVKFVKL